MFNRIIKKIQKGLYRPFDLCCNIFTETNQTGETMKTLNRLEKLAKQRAKHACEVADSEGFYRLDDNTYLYNREFLNREYMKTQGTSKYVLLIDSDMLGISGFKCSVFNRIIKKTHEAYALNQQALHSLTYKGA